MNRKFVHLHLHTRYSLLDGMCRFEGLIDAAKKDSMTSIAITDHGNMYGVMEFYSAMVKAGIHPIIGMEAYVIDDIKNNTREKGHLVLLVKNEKGYKNLMKISSRAFIEGFYYKPSIDKSFLKEHSEGLIALSSCLKGEVPSSISAGNMEEAEAAARWHLEAFGDGNYYLEMQNHGLAEQVIVNKGLKELGKKLSIPLVATNDTHYMKKEDAKAHDILVCIQTAKTLTSENRLQFTTGEFFFKTGREMQEAFPEDAEALGASFDIANKCTFEMKFPAKYHMPSYPIEGKEAAVPEDYEIYLDKIARDALKARYGDVPPPETEERFERELGVIKKEGFSGYFLIVRDIINYARANNIPVGPGRGSAAGSLISYLLGITSIDPMRYGLLFERFLNPDRVSPPDIDIDFSDDERGRIIEYIVQRFGRERTAQIITFQTLKPRQAIRDVGRVLDVPLFEVDRLAKMVPEGPNMNFENVMKNPEFVAYTNDDKTREEIVNYAIKIEGLLRQDSTHAAGIVIAPDDLTEYVPVAKPKDTDESRSDLNLMTQYPMESLDRAKLIKFDILGLRNLSVIKNALGMIKENTGKEVLLSNDDFSDAEVYAMLARGESSGVFQLESDGMRDVLMKMKPESFEDIIAIISLYRPGPMDMIDEYIKRRRGKKFEFDFPGLEPILKETYGIAVYQEQVMEIAVKIAGFSMARADILRRVMSKKKEKEMALLKVDFLKGAAERGAAKEAAEALFEKLEQFCQYGFNKSHAAAYAVVSYHTAYLKAHYPGEYMSAWLTSVMNKVEKVAQYVEECRRLNIKLMPPDVNKSGVSFTFQRGVIVYGLAAIKNVGVSAAEEIVRQRAEKGEYKSIYDFCEKVGMKAVNSKTIESLIKAGAFDFTLEKRSALFASVEAAMKLGEKRQKDILAGQGQLFGVEEKPSAVAVNSAEDWEESAILSFEKEVLGLYISNHPLAKFEKLLKSVAVPISEIKHGNVSAGDRVILGGVLDDLRKKLTPEREEKVSFRLEDLTDSITVYANEKVTEEKKTLFRNGVIFVIRGRVGFFDEKAVVFLDSIITIEEAYEKLGRYLHIKLREIGLEETALKEMHNILAMHRGGETEVILHMHAKDNSDVTMALDDNSRVKVNEELLTQLEAVVGEGNLHLSWQNKVQ